jgi:dTDP-4-dehydrorhamnose reductase
VRVLVTGAGGQLGRDLGLSLSGTVPPGGRRCALWGPEGSRSSTIDVVAADRAALPVDHRSTVLDAFEAIRPDVVVHAGAWTAVDDCESDRERAFRVNVLGTRNIAEAARRWGTHVVFVSTDYVFDGDAHRPYVEWDAPNPRSVYGQSKLGGERECPDGATIVRTSWVCGYSGRNMVKTVLKLAEADGPLRFVDDQHGSPTFTSDLAPALVTLATDKVPGLFHVTNREATTWYGFVRAVLDSAGHDPGRVHPITTAELVPPRPAPRPANSVLDNAALRLGGFPELPDWRDGLDRLVLALRKGGATS